MTCQGCEYKVVQASCNVASQVQLLHNPIVAMLLLSIITFCIVIAQYSNVMHSYHYMRASVCAFVMCLWLGVSQDMDVMSLYHGTFQCTSCAHVHDQALYLLGSVIMIMSCSCSMEKKEFSLFVMFILLGSTLLISSSDMMSVYLSLELQSFGLYLLTCLRGTTRATRAGLTYFLLGAMSSALILLGIALMYSVLGTTQLISILIQIPLLDQSQYQAQWGCLCLLCGFMFKVGAAPFHS